MTKHLRLSAQVVAAMTLALLPGTGCSTPQAAPPSAPDQAISTAARGPSVIYTRAQPGTIELNREFQAQQPAEILADVKDFGARVTDVRLQFIGIPLEVAMENVGGSTWRAQLTPRQLELLSVSGRTIHYEARVIARDEKGETGQTQTPLEVAIKTPEVSGHTGAG